MPALLEVKNLSISFPPHHFPVVENMSFSLAAGEILGICGESGSGKSQTGLSLMHLLPPEARSSGQIIYRGEEIQDLPEKAWQKLRSQELAMSFQDHEAALNPTMPVGQQISEVWKLNEPELSRKERSGKLEELLKALGFNEPWLVAKSYPHELSGGMRQRIVLALALATPASVLICDEVSTALDISLQEQILKMLAALKNEEGRSIIFISHDLRLIKAIADRVLIFYAGGIVEQGSVQQVFTRPSHAYTKALLAAMPSGAKRGQPLSEIPGQLPSPQERSRFQAEGHGCIFAPRCFYASQICHKQNPVWQEVEPKHFAACHFAQELLEDVQR